MAVLWWFIKSSVGRVALGAIVTALAGLGAWGWLKINYVPRSDYNSLRDQLAHEKAVGQEKEKAAQADAKQAEKDAARAAELEGIIDGIQPEGEDPVVWGQSTIDRLRRVRGH